MMLRAYSIRVVGRGLNKLKLFQVHLQLSLVGLFPFPVNMPLLVRTSTIRVVVIEVRYIYSNEVEQRGHNKLRFKRVMQQTVINSDAQFLLTVIL